MARGWRFTATFPFVRRAVPQAAPEDDAQGLAPLDAAGEGAFFDGASAKPHPVSIRVTGGRLTLAGPVQRSWDCRELRASDAPRPFMRVWPAGSGERLELTDAAVGAAIEAVSPDLLPRARIPYQLIGGSVAALVSTASISSRVAPAGKSSHCTPNRPRIRPISVSVAA